MVSELQRRQHPSPGVAIMSLHCYGKATYYCFEYKVFLTFKILNLFYGICITLLLLTTDVIMLVTDQAVLCTPSIKQHWLHDSELRVENYITLTEIHDRVAKNTKTIQRKK